MATNPESEISNILTNQVNKGARFGIKGQLILGYFSVLLLLIVFIATTLYFVNDIKKYSTEVIVNEFPTYDQLADLNTSIYRTETQLQRFLLSGDKKHLDDLNITWGSIKQTIAQLNDLKSKWKNEELTQRWINLQPLLDQLSSIQQKIATTYETNKQEATTLLFTDAKLVTDRIESELNLVSTEAHTTNHGIMDMQLHMLKNGSKSILENLNTFQISEYILFAIGILIILVIASYTLYVIGSITKHINEACHNIVGALEEVKHSINVQSSGTSEQASSINQITASLSEIEKSSAQTMEQANNLGNIAERTRESGQSGLEAVEQSIQSMKEIRDKVQMIAQTILDLSHQTQQVGEITTVVNNLAQQSKMLALNASIEAAKAGEAGKGFAVVAVEVKNLAEQSEQSTSQVQKILEEIRHATEKAVMVTEEGTKGVDQGKDLVEQTGSVIRSLNDVIHETTIASQQIEAAIRQEGAGIEQITVGMNEINQVTGSFVESAKQTKEAISSLTQVAKYLKNYVDKYNV